jgi:hypothetical protein
MHLHVPDKELPPPTYGLLCLPMPLAPLLGPALTVVIWLNPFEVINVLYLKELPAIVELTA